MKMMISSPSDNDGRSFVPVTLESLLGQVQPGQYVQRSQLPSGFSESFDPNWVAPEYVPSPVATNVPAAVRVRNVPVITADDFRKRQRYAESGFDDKAVSKAGAKGAYQIMPSVLNDYVAATGKKGDLFDYEYNQAVRDWYVDWLMKRPVVNGNGNTQSDVNTWAKMAAAYNWGVGNLTKYLQKLKDKGEDIYNSTDWVEGLNPETRDYVKFIALQQDTTGPRTTEAFNKAMAKYNLASDGGRIRTLADKLMEKGYYSDGGKIYIKPSKRGTFKAQATKMGMGVKEAAHHILAHKDNYSPAMVKKANFAANFAAGGGPLDNLLSNLRFGSSPLYNYRKSAEMVDAPETAYGGGRFGGSGASSSWSVDVSNPGLYDYVENVPLMDSATFSDAYSAARRAGLGEFEFNGKRYNTAYDPDAILGPVEYGVQTVGNLRNVYDADGRIIRDSTRVEPWVGQIPGRYKRERSNGGTLLRPYNKFEMGGPEEDGVDKDTTIQKDNTSVHIPLKGLLENSTLNWDAKSWLGERAENDRGPKYTDEDVRIFESHVPEYRQIEQKAKIDGTWLKMPDGSTWRGDPRDWVVMQSEAFRNNYSPNPWWTGQKRYVKDPDTGSTGVSRARYYDGTLWFSDNPDYAKTFSDALAENDKDPRRDTVTGRVFLAGVPNNVNVMDVSGPANSTADMWYDMPYGRDSSGNIVRLPDEEIIRRQMPVPKIHFDSFPRDIAKRIRFKRNKYNEIDRNVTSRPMKQKVVTDSLVDWASKLGAPGVYLHSVDDGPLTPQRAVYDPEYGGTIGGQMYDGVVDELITLPGLTPRIKFIHGNNGDFDPSKEDKYSSVSVSPRGGLS